MDIGAEFELDAGFQRSIVLDGTDGHLTQLHLVNVVGDQSNDKVMADICQLAPWGVTPVHRSWGLKTGLEEPVPKINCVGIGVVQLGSVTSIIH